MDWSTDTPDERRYEFSDVRQQDLFDAAVQVLRGFDHDTLRDKIVMPLFRKECHRPPESVDRKGEIYHGLDVLLPVSRNCIEGVQIKTGRLTTASSVKDSHADVQIMRASQNPFPVDGNRALMLNRFYLIVSKEIDHQARHYLHTIVNPVWLEVWDVYELAKQIQERAPELLKELHALEIARRAEASRVPGQFVAAAALYRSLGRWYIERRGSLSEARLAFGEASVCLSQEPHRHRYFARTMEAHLACLQEVEAHRLPSGTYELRAPDSWGRRRAQFWADVEFLFGQLEILREHSALRGVTGIQAATLLQRTGWAPEELLVQNQRKQIEMEMKDEDKRSIDHSCSLCTGSAISCLTLCRDEEKTQAPLTWLQSLADCQYRHRNPQESQVGASDHAYHYTAVAWQGLTDALGAADEQSLRARDALLGTSLEPEIVERWGRFRDQEALDMLKYTFPPILRWKAISGSLTNAQLANLETAARALVQLLISRSSFRGDRRVFYAMRENIAGLALAELLDVESPFQEVIDFVRARIPLAQRYRRLIDSNVDRAIGMLDSWLLYWESNLAASPMTE